MTKSCVSQQSLHKTFRSLEIQNEIANRLVKNLKTSRSPHSDNEIDHQLVTSHPNILFSKNIKPNCSPVGEFFTNSCKSLRNPVSVHNMYCCANSQVQKCQKAFVGSTHPAESQTTTIKVKEGHRLINILSQVVFD